MGKSGGVVGEGTGNTKKIKKKGRWENIYIYMRRKEV